MADEWVIELWDRRIVGIVKGEGTVVETWRPLRYSWDSTQLSKARRDRVLRRGGQSRPQCLENQRHTLEAAMRKMKAIKEDKADKDDGPPLTLRIRNVETGDILLGDIL